MALCFKKVNLKSRAQQQIGHGFFVGRIYYFSQEQHDKPLFSLSPIYLSLTLGYRYYQRLTKHREMRVKTPHKLRQTSQRDTPFYISEWGNLSMGVAGLPNVFLSTHLKFFKKNATCHLPFSHFGIC